MLPAIDFRVNSAQTSDMHGQSGPGEAAAGTTVLRRKALVKGEAGDRCTDWKWWAMHNAIKEREGAYRAVSL